MQLMNLKYLSGLLLLVSLTNKVFSQTENCSFKSTFEQAKGRIFDEDYKIPVLEFMESNKEKYLSEENNRTLIIDFFFDETKYQILREKIEDEYWAKNGIFFIKGNLLK